MTSGGMLMVAPDNGCRLGEKSHGEQRGDLLDSRDFAGLGPGTRLKESRADGRCQVAGMVSCVLSPGLFPFRLGQPEAM